MSYRYRLLIIFLLLSSLVWGFSSGIAGAKSPIGLYLDGIKINLSVPPVQEKNEVMVPLDAIAQALGAEVRRQQKNTIIIKDLTTIVLNDRAVIADVNGIKKTMPVPLKTIKGSTMMPLRWLLENLGFSQTWSPKNNSIYIKEKPAQAWHMFQGGPKHIGVAGFFNVAPPFKLAWKYDTGWKVVSTPVSDGKYIFVGNHEGRITALEARTGVKAWDYLTTGNIASAPAIWGNALIVASEDHKVYALNRHTGKLLWQYTAFAPIWSSPTVHAGVVYFGADDGRVYALKAADGKVLWTLEVGERVVASPAVSGSLLIIGVHSKAAALAENLEDGAVVALNRITGKKVWQYDMRGSVWSSAVIDGETAIIGNDNRQVMAMKAGNGKVLWEFAADGWVRTTPALYDGKIYFGTNGGRLYAVDAKTGVKTWEFEAEASITGSPIITPKYVILASKDYKVYVLDRLTGKKLWEQDTGYILSATPLVTANLIIVPSEDGFIYAYGK